jgi:hypothetical protein
MNSPWSGFLIALVVLGILYFLFRDSIHIGNITNKTDSVLVIKAETLRVPFPVYRLRDIPARIDTVPIFVLPDYSVDSNIVRASLDTVFRDGEYSDSLHISYLEGIHIWEDVFLKIQPREIADVDSSWKVHTIETVHEINWFWTLFFTFLGFILGGIL